MRSAIALVGRPNVGKSTLFNRLTRRRDALVADVPGLTRDRRYGVAEFGDRPCTLIDTGGLFDVSEVAGLMAQQAAVAIEEADLVLFVVDARAGLTPCRSAACGPDTICEDGHAAVHAPGRSQSNRAGLPTGYP